MDMLSRSAPTANRGHTCDACERAINAGAVVATVGV